jgi:hypothetical protein
MVLKHGKAKWLDYGVSSNTQSTNTTTIKNYNVNLPTNIVLKKGSTELN